MQEVTIPTVSLETNITPVDINDNPRKQLDAALKKYNFKVDNLVACGVRGMNAKKTIRGEFGDPEEVDDLAVQHKFFHSFLLLMGLIKEGGSNTQVTIISPQERELVDAFKRRVDV